MKPDSKMRYICGKDTELNKIYGNFYWKIEFQSEYEHSYRRVIKVYNEGISKWVLLTRSGKRSEKRDGSINVKKKTVMYYGKYTGSTTANQHLKSMGAGNEYSKIRKEEQKFRKKKYCGQGM